MPSWNPHLYSKFGSERMQPAIDLVARIHAEAPGWIIDLGCGSGTSTRVLRDRWPNARVSASGEFKSDLPAEYRNSYPVARNQKVLFPFNRQFVVAHVK